jgi:hypothetical protein
MQYQGAWVALNPPAFPTPKHTTPSGNSFACPDCTYLWHFPLDLPGHLETWPIRGSVMTNIQVDASVTISYNVRTTAADARGCRKRPLLFYISVDTSWNPLYLEQSSILGNVFFTNRLLNRRGSMSIYSKSSERIIMKHNHRTDYEWPANFKSMIFFNQTRKPLLGAPCFLPGFYKVHRPQISQRAFNMMFF